nr:MAG TPA_asm: hypothetical protein [Caudoviricetes sp.]
MMLKTQKVDGGILYIHINKKGLSTKIFFQNKGQNHKLK